VGILMNLRVGFPVMEVGIESGKLNKKERIKELKKIGLKKFCTIAIQVWWRSN
jgi:hypothetical protein